MKNILNSMLLMAALSVAAQRQVTEELPINNQDELILDFAIANEIQIKTWKENKVKVEVSVSINEGEHDHLFELESQSASHSLSFKHDKAMFESKEWKKRNCWQSDIYYTVYLPKSMTLDINTISADIVLVSVSNTAYLKTISGDIDITVIDGLEFKAKTISGEVYSDLDIDYPEGRDGLRQIVGMTVKGVIGAGKNRFDLETISGNIFLRKG